MALHLEIILALESGVPAHGPIVTTSLGEAEERFKGPCEHYNDDPHDDHGDEVDIWWWEVEI